MAKNDPRYDVLRNKRGPITRGPTGYAVCVGSYDARSDARKEATRRYMGRSGLNYIFYVVKATPGKIARK